VYIEYACYDEQVEADVRKNVFRALDLGVHGISVPHIFLGKLSDILAEGTVISAPIDYPLGKSDPKIRQHTILKAIHCGANAIDLVAQSVLILNDRVNEYIADISSAKRICDDNGVTLRVMIDYRVIDWPLIVESCVICKTLNIEYLFMSNGHYVDDYRDNMLLCHQIHKDYNISTICNGNIYMPQHLEMIRKAKVFGARFHKITALERCLVYNKTD